jgi:hypothetical protein
VSRVARCFGVNVLKFQQSSSYLSSGADMSRLISIALTALIAVSLREPRTGSSSNAAGPAQDIRELLAAARGAPAALCSLAAAAVGNYGWGVRRDAPATPLGASEPRPSLVGRREPMTSQDIGFLLESLSIDDSCVREVAVRLLGQQRTVRSPLVCCGGSPRPIPRCERSRRLDSDWCNPTPQ